MASVFKNGSQVDTLNKHFKSGGSITHEEANSMFNIGRLAQRMQDLKNKYIEHTGDHPIMAYDEVNEKRTGIHTRYFYKGCNCSFEFKENVRKY